MKEGESQKVKIDYRIWNAFRSKLAAAVLNGIESIYIKPGAKVLYLGAANGTTVSHVSDIVGEVNKYYINKPNKKIDWNSIRCRIF